MSKTSSKTSNTQRTVLGGLSGAVIIIIVLFLQYGLGVDLLEEDGNGTPDAGSAVPTAFVPTGSDGVDLAPIPGGWDGGWIQIYFTDPNNTDGQTSGSPVEAALVKAIGDAKTSVYAAIFEINSQPITQALVAAKRNGVDVRVVTDDRYGIEPPDSTIPDLEAAGIPVVPDDSRSRLMHNKFFVFDGAYVWTGSTNVTENGMYENNNNALYIRNSRLAQYYTKEFSEMFDARQFGPTSSAEGESDLSVTVDGTLIEVYFESEGNAEQRLWELVNTSSTVKFMAFSFTDSMTWKDADKVEHSAMTLLRDRAAAGQTAMQGVVEGSSIDYVEPLYCAGLDVRKDGNRDGMLHHKVFIFDDSIVATGSFNFSGSASSKNDENMLIIHSKALAQAYLDEFNKRWAEAQDASGEFDC